MLKLLINGICGRMGHTLYAVCNASEDAFLVACGVDATPSDGTLACPVYPDFSNIAETIDVIIDFSVPAGAEKALAFALERRIPIVVGTTGLTARDMKLLSDASERIPVFQTGNMSLGVNVQRSLAKQAAAALGNGFDVEIIEKHHNSKVDAPSGTALMLADSIAAQYAEDREYVYGRHESSKRRAKNEIGIHSIRGGTIVGEHEVEFIGKDEVIEITHKAFSKQVFAVGALRAAAFIADKSCGRFEMQDVIDAHDTAPHLTLLEDQAVVTIAGLEDAVTAASDVLALLDAAQVQPDMLSLPVSGKLEACIGFSVSQHELPCALNALKALQRAHPSVDINPFGNVTKLIVERMGTPLAKGAAARLLALFADANAAVRLITANDTRIEFCVDAVDANRIVERINALFSLT